MTTDTKTQHTLREKSGTLKKNNRRVAIVGIDGMPWSALKVYIDSGAMPCLRKILQKAYKARLKPLVPITGPSWIDMATTVNPGKHGIFDFLKLDERTFTWRSNTPLDVKHPRLHEMLAFEGKTSILVNIPFTMPPVIDSPKSYTIFSSWLYKKITEIYPQEKAKTVFKRISSVKTHEAIFKALDFDIYLEKLENFMRMKVEVAEKLLQDDWNFFFIIFSESDWIFHKVYGDVIRRTKLGRKTDRLMNIIDKFLEKLLDLLGENSLLMVVSDHGFAEHKRALNVNVLLKKIGYLKTTLDTKRLIMNNLIKLIPPKVKARLKSHALTALAGTRLHDRTYTMPIDYMNSIAFMQTLCNIYVNPRLPRAVRKKVASRIIEELSKYKEHLGLIVHKEELYHGPYVEEAPEVIVLPGKTTISARMISGKILDEGTWYSHSPYGIFIAYGEQVLPGEGGEVWSFDVGATALYYLGCPLPHTCDGRPLKKIFTAEVDEKLRFRNYLDRYLAALRIRRIKWETGRGR